MQIPLPQRLKQLQSPTLVFAQIALLRFAKERETLKIIFRIWTANPKWKALKKKSAPRGEWGFQTHPLLQHSVSCTHTHNSQHFNPCLQPTVTMPENILLSAFQIPFSVKGCSCKAAGQIQILLKYIHFGWWSQRNLSTTRSAVLKAKKKSSLEMWCCYT